MTQQASRRVTYTSKYQQRQQQQRNPRETKNWVDINLASLCDKRTQIAYHVEHGEGIECLQYRISLKCGLHYVGPAIDYRVRDLHARCR